MRNKVPSPPEWTELDPEPSFSISSLEDTPMFDLTNDGMISPPTTPEPDSPPSRPRPRRRKGNAGAPTSARDSIETAVDNKKDRKRKKHKKRKSRSLEAMDVDSSPSPEPSNEEKPSDPCDDESVRFVSQSPGFTPHSPCYVPQSPSYGPWNEEKLSDSGDDEPVAFVVQNLRERNPRWKNEGKPVNDLSQVPEGWNCMEPDLEETDYDAQIERCWERIDDGYMVDYFKKRLETLLDARTQLQKVIDSEPRGLDLNVVHRLQNLKLVRRHLKETNDKYEELPNVRAIMKAYRSRKLEWNNGMVTYWAGGKMLGKPRAFDWDECLKLNEDTKEQGAFWVEGLHGPGPIQQNAVSMVLPCMGGTGQNHYMNTMWLNVQLAKCAPTPNPNLYAAMANTSHALNFTDDTGSSVMTFYQDDYELMAGSLLNPPHPLTAHCRPCILGFCSFVQASGSSYVNMVVAVTVNMPGPTQAPIKRHSSRITASVSSYRRGDPNGPNCRLAGPWLRHMLYTGSSPDNMYRMFVSTHKGALTQLLTAPNHEDALPPRPGTLDNIADYNPAGHPVPGAKSGKAPW